jgi:hypothetical protein
VLFILSLTVCAAAQQAPTSRLSDWSRVQALRPGTAVLLNATTRHGGCTIKSVDAASLTCTSGSHPVIAVSEITSIKIPHRGRSALIGATIGGGIGAIGGYAAAGPDSPGSFNIVTRGDVAVIFAVPLAIIGGLIGVFTHFASTTLYHV